MNDSRFVSSTQHIAQLREQSAGAIRGETVAALDEEVEVDSAQILHHQDRTGGIIGIAVVVSDGIGMVEAGHDVDFAPKVFAGFRLRQQVILEHLDDDVSSGRRPAVPGTPCSFRPRRASA